MHLAPSNSSPLNDGSRENLKMRGPPDSNVVAYKRLYAGVKYLGWYMRYVGSFQGKMYGVGSEAPDCPSLVGSP
ncbi:uncharacterized protein B0T23DRAFT_428676 [Neurospora hispaniola]|uniref:Uncharacterized protein n=1 Tax=Neurospora hispaniola TaxID=588809 RepID=A0AAJ0I7P5_9PEZI|nr:hypothetical protein B0T23DRAFT_428676 [Neurospora hispaniola]